MKQVTSLEFKKSGLLRRKFTAFAREKGTADLLASNTKIPYFAYRLQTIGGYEIISSWSISKAVCFFLSPSHLQKKICLFLSTMIKETQKMHMAAFPFKQTQCHLQYVCRIILATHKRICPQRKIFNRTVGSAMSSPLAEVSVLVPKWRLMRARVYGQRTGR